MINTPVKLWRRGKNISQLIGKSGKIFSFTLVRVPNKNFSDQAPYPVVIVDFDHGQRMVGQLVDWDDKELKIGTKVVAVMRRITVEGEKENIIPYGIKFRPL